MVKYDDQPLDRTFAALADPTRRALLAHLAAEPGVSVSDLARPFPVSLPAIMKHLDVLSDAGLVRREKTGRTVRCQLNAAPMEAALDWLHRYEKFWTDQLDRLAAFLEDQPCDPNPASRSSESSKAGPRPSTPPGPTRRR
jgi:DNA-binding transcriptional ArsR family regulator